MFEPLLDVAAVVSRIGFVANRFKVDASIDVVASVSPWRYLYVKHGDAASQVHAPVQPLFFKAKHFQLNSELFGEDFDVHFFKSLTPAVSRAAKSEASGGHQPGTGWRRLDQRVRLVAGALIAGAADNLIVLTQQHELPCLFFPRPGPAPCGRYEFNVPRTASNRCAERATATHCFERGPRTVAC